jgi:5-methylcytosine-specific restriction enzyme A
MEVANFQRGRLYTRRIDIHERFGGQQQGGISTPKEAPYIFIFTGDSGSQYGYEDDWIDDGVYLYVGEGQVGDMQFRAGNKAIRDHAQNGKELLLFKTLGKGRPVRFDGRFACSSWEYRRGPDKEGNDRQIIAFHLISTDDEELADDHKTLAPTGVSLDELRRRAYRAATETATGKSKNARQTYYQRSQAVKDYVLARAAGICESCDKPAPFNRQKGDPYLEPHHTRRVSDAGPDHPRWVAAVCPNCHREIHHGESGGAKNDALMDRLGLLEPAD